MATLTEQILAFLERIHDQVLAAALNLLEVEPTAEVEEEEECDSEEVEAFIESLFQDVEPEEEEQLEIPVVVGRDERGRLVAEGPDWIITQVGGTVEDLLQVIIQQVLEDLEDPEVEDEAALDDVWED